MLIPIDNIIVNDRIRKDYGNIDELAQDIKDNGLINPPVVNKDYVLLAGERRLKACKTLGWQQIEVHMMDTRDAEHELNIEISENESRKEFSKSERVDYMKRLMRIESAKARERKESGYNQYTDADSHRENFPEGSGRARDKTASQFGVSGKQMEREISIVDHKELLDPADFADWDEGKLSTNKAYIKLKERLKALETEKDATALKNKVLESEKVELEDRNKALEDENESMRGELASIDSPEELESELEEVKGQLADAVETIKALKTNPTTIEKEVVIHADEKELKERDDKIRELEEKLAKASQKEEKIDLSDITNPEELFHSFIDAFKSFNRSAVFFRPTHNGFEQISKDSQRAYTESVTELESLLKRAKNCLAE